MRWLVLIPLLLPTAGMAQRKAAPKRAPAAAPAPATDKWPIQTLSVEGNRIYTRAQVLAVAGLKAGQVAGKPEFEAARERLLATGAFETVGYRFRYEPGQQGSTASFQVVEVEQVYPVRFEELRVPDKEILDRLRKRDPLFTDRMAATRPVLDRYTKTIQELLDERKVDEKVIGRIAATGPDQFVMLFRPARPSPAVAQVSFSGNQAVTTKALQNAVSTLAVGFPYNEERFRQLLDNAVRPLYDARGRIRMKFTRLTTAPAADVQGLDVTVAIDDGPTYDLGKAQIEGTTPFKPEELLKLAKFKTGDLANFDQINDGVGRIRKAVQRNGYMRVETSVERRIDDAKHTVDLVVHVKEGPQFLAGKLTIEGLDLNAEAAIRKMWNMKEGKPYNGDYPDFFLRRVREEGIFDNLKRTRAATKINEQDRTVDVTLYFNEPPPKLPPGVLPPQEESERRGP